MPNRRRASIILTLLAGVSVASVLLALTAGSVRVPLPEVFAAFFGTGGEGGISAEVVTRLRLPRALAGFACGGLLALSGALLQVLLRNPLADPYILGISGGAGVGAILSILFGLSVAGVAGASFAGALAAMLLVFGLARGDGSWTQTRLLLTGVIVAAGCGALVALILSISPDDKLHGMLFWIMGDLSQATHPGLALAALAVVLLVALPFARELNLLSRGPDTALSLGARVGALRRGVYLAASLATAAAVAQAGSIGFVGLIVPHLIRLAVGNDQRLLLPASVLAGGSLLAVADTLARTVIAPQQLPVGVLTALIGVPVFLFLLARDSRPRPHAAPDSPAPPMTPARPRIAGDSETESGLSAASPAVSGETAVRVLLTAHRLSVGIGARIFCRDLDLELRAGERLGILGRNGAGKSTLLSVLAGLRAPLAGELRLEGAGYAELGPRRAARLRGWLPQSRSDAFASTVLETALVGRHPHLGRWDWESARDVRIVRQALAAVGLEDFERRDIQTLSGGERQRLAIATLLAQQPELFLLDEPVAYLDLKHQIAMLTLFAGAAREQGAAVVMALHEPALAWRFCDRVLLIHGGGRCECGPAAEMLNSERLSSLYDYPLRVFERDGQLCLIPG